MAVEVEDRIAKLDKLVEEYVNFKSNTLKKRIEQEIESLDCLMEEIPEDELKNELKEIKLKFIFTTASEMIFMETRDENVKMLQEDMRGGFEDIATSVYVDTDININENEETEQRSREKNSFRRKIYLLFIILSLAFIHNVSFIE